MSAETVEGYDGFTRWWLRFRAWRGTRPFWAGLFTVASSVPILYVPYGHVHLGTLTVTIGTQSGAGALIIGGLLFTLGLTMWLQSAVRVFAGVASILLGLVSIPVTNMGGLVVGFVLAIIGGCLSVSWAPGTPAPPAAEDSTPEGYGGTAPAFPAAPREGTDPFLNGTTTDQVNGGGHSAG